MRKLAVLLATGVLVCAAVEAEAQTTAQVVATITIPEVLRIDVNTPDITFTPDAADYTGADILVPANEQTTVTTVANVPHSVTVEASAASMPEASDPLQTKDTGDLEWSLDGSVWSPLSIAAAEVETGLDRGANQTVVQYRMNWKASDAPGEYQVTLTYTVVGP